MGVCLFGILALFSSMTRVSGFRLGGLTHEFDNWMLGYLAVSGPSDCR